MIANATDLRRFIAMARGLITRRNGARNHHHQDVEGREVKGGTLCQDDGDGLVQRGKTWWLDFSHQGFDTKQAGQEHQPDRGRELAAVERSKALRQDAGIGGKKRKDISFDKLLTSF
jgi:hypothetical protein